MDAKEIQKKVMTMQDRHGSIPKAGQDQIEKPSGNQFHVRQGFYVPPPPEEKKDDKARKPQSYRAFDQGPDGSGRIGRIVPAGFFLRIA